MISFKKNKTVSGKIKNIATNGSTFFDDETGEVINLAEVLYSVYGEQPFDMSTSQKNDEDIELGGEYTE